MLLPFCNSLENIHILLQAVSWLYDKQQCCCHLHKVQWSFSFISLVCFQKRTCMLPKAQAYAGKLYHCVFKGSRRETRQYGLAVEGQNCLQEFLSIAYIQSTKINIKV